jgi:hypothetical protein
MIRGAKPPIHDAPMRRPGERSKQMIASSGRVLSPKQERARPDVHSKGSRAKVLLSSVFGPYAQDDQYGSRRMNPMELYHNQVTREQGPFSLRMFHRSWGLMLIQDNISARCALLDFPALDRFVDEIRDSDYDIVGISSIPLNVLKVRKMCQLVREHLPRAKIVVGGHVANIPDLGQRIDADHIVRGEGVRWFRRYLGEDPEQPLRHPETVSGVGSRTMGLMLDRPGSVAATLIPSVGCPIGCNFCATSAMFGGKGKSIDFYPSGDELFDVMCQLEQSMKVQSFFMMDENFLLRRRRALRILQLMQQHDKAWTLYLFSSGNVLRGYSIEQLVGLGISWVWMGLEGKNSQYTKLRDVDTLQLVRRLQSHGVHVLGSTIIGMESHTPENIDSVIDYAVRHDTDFHQFMLYMPVVGTPLYDQLLAQGRMKDESEYHPGDAHGQSIFNYRHPHIKEGQETEFMVRAFQRDFQRNGPSVLRIVRTALAGWKRYKDHPDARIRHRFAREVKQSAGSFSAAVWAARGTYRRQPRMGAKMSGILRELYGQFGWKSRLSATLGGSYVLWMLRREQKRLAAGWTYEPPTFYDKNYSDYQTGGKRRPVANRCRFVAARITTDVGHTGDDVQTQCPTQRSNGQEIATVERTTVG